MVNEPDFKSKELIHLEPSALHATLAIRGQKSHNASVFFNILVILGWVYLILGIFNSALNLHFLSDFWFQMQPGVIIFGSLYIFYIIEVFCSSTFRSLINKKDDSSLREYIASIKKTRPEIQFSGQCSHTEMDDSSESDSSDDDGILPALISSTVVTLKPTESFRYSICNDESEEFPEQIYKYQFLEIEFDKCFKLANRESELAYQDQYNTFIENNQKRDMEFKHESNLILDNFKQNMMANNSSKHSSGAKIGTFLFVSLVLLMSWPYRLWMERFYYRGKYTFTKVLTV